MTPDKSEACPEWGLIEKLRAEEGTTILLMGDNPDFNGQPNSRVIITADWTNWEEQHFTGDTVLQCLQAAYEAMTRK